MSGWHRVHPRGCGESAAVRGPRGSGPGPSPRVRGIPGPVRQVDSRLGSIPAGAGNPCGGRAGPRGAGVHPRGCGESWGRRCKEMPTPGPSPRVRGIRSTVGRLPRGSRSIPAGAGNPRGGPGAASNRRVHPRGCGESGFITPRSVTTPGPSPRVRGIRHHARPAADGPRSIPAGAGNPGSARACRPSDTVHPRGCGESQVPHAGQSLGQGPSPRVRGIPSTSTGRSSTAGSIPAGAGNPRAISTHSSCVRVHPRGCGESDTVIPAGVTIEGPSPRVRGILSREIPDLPRFGSIPAGAGNPFPPSCTRRFRTVHPRGCGESDRRPDFDQAVEGPSPRVRGIPETTPHRSGLSRSIPAGAGNPRRSGGRAGRGRVHPRGCGESGVVVRYGSPAVGPSPRVRGIPPPAAARNSSPRSIPAGAGNPGLPGV